jgi:subtilisin family serine protease
MPLKRQPAGAARNRQGSAPPDNRPVLIRRWSSSLRHSKDAGTDMKTIESLFSVAPGNASAWQIACRAAWVVLLMGTLVVRGLQVPTAEQRPPYRLDRVLVEPDQGVSAERLQRLHESLGIRVANRLGIAGEVHVLEVPPGTDIEGTVDRYLQSGLVLRAEPDYLMRLNALPNDPFFGSQWSLHNTGQSGGWTGADINAVQAWDVLRSASNVIVAVIDTGIHYTHEDIAANLWVNRGEIAGNGLDDDDNGFIDDIHGINAIHGTGDPMDPSGHGTHVAGIIGAVGNNGLGIAGVAWQVQLMALRFIDDDGSGATSDAIRCVDYARENGAHVINASWGGARHSSFLESALRRARDADILFVTGAGNEAVDIDEHRVYPGSYEVDNIVVVTSTTESDELAWYSNYGAGTVHLAAPGSHIYSTFGGSDRAYAYQTGTSMSAPIVAGALALMRARYPYEDYLQLIERLLATVQPLASLEQKTVSGGRLDLHQALGPGTSLSVRASSGLAFYGFAGGPFEPASLAWTLKNVRAEPVQWSGNLSVSWASLSDTAGTLDPAETFEVTVRLDPDAAALDPGVYTATVQFMDEGLTVARTGDELSLRVYEAPELQVRLEPGDEGRVRLRALGIPGWTCSIEASADLVNWRVLEVHKADLQGLVEVTGIGTGGISRRYYRARFDP